MSVQSENLAVIRSIAGEPVLWRSHECPEPKPVAEPADSQEKTA